MNKFSRFRESCTARGSNNTQEVSRTGIPGNVIDSIAEPHSTYEISSDEEDVCVPSHNDISPNDIMCISVTDTESENEVDDVNSKEHETPIGDRPAKRRQIQSIKEQKKQGFTVKCAWKRCLNFFESQDAMVTHETTYHRQPNELDARKEAIEHIYAVHVQRNKLKCTFTACSRFFYRKDYLQYHVMYEHTKNGALPAKSKRLANGGVANKQRNAYFPVKYPQCKEFFASVDAVWYHVETYHAVGIKRTFKCHLCKKVLINQTKLQFHMNALHSHQTRLHCLFPKCLAIFYHNDSPRLHTQKYQANKTVETNEPNVANGNVINDRNNDNFLVRCELRNCREIFGNESSMEYTTSHNIIDIKDRRHFNAICVKMNSQGSTHCRPT